MNLQGVGNEHQEMLNEEGHQLDCFFNNSLPHQFNSNSLGSEEERSEQERCGPNKNLPHLSTVDQQQRQVYLKPDSQLLQRKPTSYRSSLRKRPTSSSSSQHLDNIINQVAARPWRPSTNCTSEQYLARQTEPHCQDYMESTFDYSEHLQFPSKSGVNYEEECFFEDHPQLTIEDEYSQQDNYEQFECLKGREFEEEIEHRQYLLEEDAPQTDFGRKGPTTKVCDTCGLFLRHPSKIAAHMRTHTGEKPFLCEICGQDFSQRTPYRMHMKRHLGDLPFACTLCSKKFPNKASRNGHELRVHRGLQRQGSPQPHLKLNSNSMHADGQKRPTTNAQLTGPARSKLSHAPRSVIVNWQPPLGEIKPTSETALRKITSVVEAVAAGCNPTATKTQRICRGALESTTSSREPRQRPPTVAQCTDCGLIFKHPSKIQAHMRTHTGEKPFLCEKCGLGCSTNSALRVHIRRFHTGERPHECTWECGMRFVSVAARNEHERIVHAGIKRYQCTVGDCRRLFTRRSYLMKHLSKDHTGQLEENQAVQNIDYAKLHLITSDCLYKNNNNSLVIPLHQSRLPQNSTVEEDTPKQEFHAPDLFSQPHQFQADFETLYENEVHELQLEDYPQHLNQEESFEFEDEPEQVPGFIYHHHPFEQH